MPNLPPDRKRYIRTHLGTATTPDTRIRVDHNNMLITTQINPLPDLKNMLGTGVDTKSTAFATFYLYFNLWHRLYYSPNGSIFSPIIATGTATINKRELYNG